MSEKDLRRIFSTLKLENIRNNETKTFVRNCEIIIIMFLRNCKFTGIKNLSFVIYSVFWRPGRIKSGTVAWTLHKVRIDLDYERGCVNTEDGGAAHRDFKSTSESFFLIIPIFRFLRLNL